MSSFVNNLTTVSPEGKQSQSGYLADYNERVEAIGRILDFIHCPLYTVISAVSIVTNLINMIVFYRQGILADSCTPILAGMALSDFCCSLNYFVVRAIAFREDMGLIKLETDAALLVHLYSLSTFTSMPIRMFLEISSWITVFLSIERTISVALPFRVKSICTPTRSCIAVGTIWIYGIFIYFPNFLKSKLIWMTFLNGTVRILFVEATEIISMDFYYLVLAIRDLPFRITRIVIVAICNIIIFVKVKKSKQFKKTSTSKDVTDMSSNQNKNETGDKSKSNSNPGTSGQQQRRETKLMRMVLVLTSVYILCFFPKVVHQICNYVEVYLYKFGYWFVPYWAMIKASDWMEILNIGVNFFIYYKMSSKFRATLKQLCGRRRK